MNSTLTIRATGLDGAAIDSDWYTAVARFAQHTPWLHGVVVLYTNAGLVLLAVLMLLAWRAARHQPAATMVVALWTPVAVLLAYGVSNLVKIVVQEPRPCRALPAVTTVTPCEFATDYSFPSNHAVLAAAAAVALLIAHRRLGAIAVVVAVLMGLSRVYVGAHYPHDVLAGFVLGATAGPTGLLVRPALTGPVQRLRHGRLHTLLGPPMPLTHSTASL